VFGYYEFVDGCFDGVRVDGGVDFGEGEEV